MNSTVVAWALSISIVSTVSSFAILLWCIKCKNECAKIAEMRLEHDLRLITILEVAEKKMASASEELKRAQADEARMINQLNEKLQGEINETPG